MGKKAAAIEALTTHGLLNELKVAVDEITRATIHEKGIYGLAIRASVAKSFEFTSLVHQDPPPEHGFFITATLRGICEDLITFTFLESLSEDDRNQALTLLMNANLAEGIAAQSDFFSLNRPWQPVVQPSKQSGEVAEQQLRTLSAKLGWTGRQSWPTVWHMAKVARMHELYSYLYSTTSKWVHFSPQILLRMGWGGGKDDHANEHTEWKFTTTNFSRYYAEFSQIYSLLLLLKLLRGPAATFLPDIAQKIVIALETRLNEPIRWPEAVTYEELNLEGPTSIMRIFLRATHEIKSEVKRGG
ncbi:DUF5677 domain-containing protein [Polaromonas sp. CT11-55]|uniref:DUF5677 domain-containing protein n=1 Tax=Polaromonas sp. CT11-55 TaxID=3243045 RepID=UPI0039A75C76